MTIVLESVQFLMQEIKFEPKVMCEHIDKKLTFRASQVCQQCFFDLRNAELELNCLLINSPNSTILLA